MALTTFASADELVGAASCPLGTSGWITPTQDDVIRFGDVTRARQWIHVDAERARREGPFGVPVVHGYLTLSLATWFLNELLAVEGLTVGVNYGIDRARFPAPLPVGAPVRATGKLVRAERQGDGVRTVVELVCETEGGGKPVCVADVVSLLLP